MADTYTLHIAGLTRELPVCKVNDHMDIAAFIMFSDVELTEACAAALLKKAPEFDVILTAEAKGIPLAYEMARQSGKYWIPARKGPKLYMREPVIIEDQSITTAGKQTVWLDHEPRDFKNAAAAGADLILSGHTHGGQVWPAGAVGMVAKNERNYGRKNIADHCDAIVSGGTGTWGYKFRTQGRTEIVCAEITTERKN